MTKENLVVDPADNKDLNLDGTGANDWGDAKPELDEQWNPITPKKKNNFDKMKDKLKEKLDEKDESIETLREEIDELKKKDAIREFWPEVVESEKVKEIMSRYPWMWWAEASKLADIAPKPSAWAYGFPWTTPSEINTETKTVTVNDLEKLAENSPEKYKEAMTRINTWDLTVL